MTISVCIEKMETRWIAYASSLPGCFASHPDREKALAALPGAVREYLDWCRWNGVAVAGVDAGEPLEVQEIIIEWSYPNGEAVNAFFAADAQPLSSAETSMAAALLDWTRADLLKAIDGLDQETMDQPVVEEWNISGIFYHTLRADRWYLSTLQLAPGWEDAPVKQGDAAVLEWTQSLYLAALPKLAGSQQITVVDGETWSPRKLLRRALWHRRDHTAHIYQFRDILGTGNP